MFTLPAVSSKKIFSYLTNNESNWLLIVAHKFILGLNTFTLIIILLFIKFLPPKIPLWFSKPWGDEQLAQPLWLFTLPIGSFLWYGINRYLVRYISEEDLVFRQILFSATLITAFLSLVIVVSLITLML